MKSGIFLYSVHVKKIHTFFRQLETGEGEREIIKEGETEKQRWTERESARVRDGERMRESEREEESVRRERAGGLSVKDR